MWEPYFCYNTALPTLCSIFWYFVLVVGICVILWLITYPWRVK